MHGSNGFFSFSVLKVDMTIGATAFYAVAVLEINRLIEIMNTARISCCFVGSHMNSSFLLVVLMACFILSLEKPRTKSIDKTMQCVCGTVLRFGSLCY